jgi:hypothetical protein
MNPSIQVGSKWEVLPTPRNTVKNGLRAGRIVEVVYVDATHVSIYDYGHADRPATLELKVPLDSWGGNFRIVAWSNGQLPRRGHFERLYR